MSTSQSKTDRYMQDDLEEVIGTSFLDSHTMIYVRLVLIQFTQAHAFLLQLPVQLASGDPSISAPMG